MEAYRRGWLDSPEFAELNDLRLETVRQVFELKAEVEGLRVDAARYRWLRAQPVCAFHDVGWQIRHHWKDRAAKEGGFKNGMFTICLNGISLDETIDDARAPT